jgi:leucyl-tRNA synthetase
MVTESKEYDFHRIESRWQSFWERERAFRAGAGPSRPKFYVLDMFPYPSGSGLHIGHPEGYTATDILARYKRARGFDVLHPIGWDAFGLPAEQHAVRTGTHPAANTQNNIANFRRQIKALGFSYDWDREIDTTDPAYFRWTQWIFLQLFRRGLAYVDERPVWWCEELRTVLANEEVVDGRSEVGGFPVERRSLRQWVLRITAYADRLLAGLEGLDWPDSTKRMQAAWIGRSEGAEIAFGVADPGAAAGLPGTRAAASLAVYTTRPDTLFGCTFMVLAPEHPLVASLTSPGNRAAVDEYRRRAAAKSDLERTDLAKDKSGVFTGSYAVNPVNGEPLAVWIADYVLMGYGTGAIMAVPAHDERDFEFATRYGLPIVPVIEPGGPPADGGPARLPYTGDGSLVRSGAYTGLGWREAKRRITDDLAARGAARHSVNYRLRDWLFSRQRYWGEPIPIVWVSGEDYRRAAPSLGDQLPREPVSYEENGVERFALPLPEAALPLELPPVQSYLPSGTGESALANVAEWVDIGYDFATGRAVAGPAMPQGATWVRARRETNTMPQWAGSCWYYLRFTDPRNARAFASAEALARWGTPDLYVGGAEHAVLHLLYARFWHKVLFDMGAVPTDEPFTRLFHQGVILGEDGEKMSKSRGNVVSPDTIIESHGADSLRLYLMFLGPLEAMKPWNPRGIEGVHRFLLKVWRDCVGEDGRASPRIADDAPEPAELQRLLHETIRKVGEDIEGLRFNTAISQMMILENALHREARVGRATVLAFLQILAPFAPHFAEEVWSRLGAPGRAAEAPWPAFDPARLAAAQVRLVFQVNGKHRGDQLVPVGLPRDEAVALARAHPKVAPFLAGRTLEKVVYVPDRILNLVVS